MDPIRRTSRGNYKSSVTGSSSNGEIRGVRFLDTNENRQKDEGEAGLPNRTVYLDLNKNGVMDGDNETGEPRTVTNAEGQYVFQGLGYQPYFVAAVIPENSNQTFPLTNPGHQPEGWRCFCCRH